IALLGLCFIRKTNIISTLGLSVFISTLIFGYTFQTEYIPAKDIYAQKMHVYMNIDRIASSTDDYISVIGNIELDGRKHKSIIYIEDTSRNYQIGDNIEANVNLYYSNSDYNLGQRIFIKGYTDYAYRRHRELSLTDKLIHSIDEYCAMYPDDIGSIIKAFITGDKYNMDENIRNDFSISGTAHIIAVSGLHMSVLLGFCIKLMGRRAGSLVGVPLIFAYAFISGFSPSAFRAVIMSTMMVLAFFLKRDYNIYISYFVSMYIILCCNPFSIYNISFLLSFASVAGIIIVYPAINSRINSILKKRNIINMLFRFIAVSAAISFSASVFSNLVSARYFTRLSLISMLSNIFIVVPSSILLISGIFNYFIWSISVQAATFIAEYIVSPLAQLILYLNKVFSYIPFASVRTAAEYLYPTLVCLAILSVIFIIVRKKLWIFAAAGIFTVTIFCYDNYLFEQNHCFISIDYVNYQPMAFISSKDETYIIGGGNGNSSNTLKYIDRKLFEYNTSPEALFISKMNKANITGAIKVKEKYPECRIYGSDYTRKEYPLQYIRYKNNVVKSENINVGFETLPYNDGIITLSIGETDILWLPSITENRMTEYFETDSVKDADIVVIGDLYYMNKFKDKIMDFPSLEHVIICNNKDATWINDTVNGVKITQTSREDVTIVLPI
ncbi:MAG: ComEC/Rec2 family competence protein, partial [Clostridia bacterium]|nr:ComEC/Rec2 family competence protein [Clostridia bacterium]